MLQTDNISSNLPIGEIIVWDFGFRYNIYLIDDAELEVLMIKYKTELRRSAGDAGRLHEITAILGKIHKEIMARRLQLQIEKIENIQYDKRKSKKNVQQTEVCYGI